MHQFLIFNVLICYIFWRLEIDPDWPTTVYLCGGGWSAGNGKYTRAVRVVSGYSGEYQYNQVGTATFMYRGSENSPNNNVNPATSRWNLYYPTTSKSVYRGQSYQDVKILEMDMTNDWDTWNVPQPGSSYDLPYIKTSAC